MNILHAHYFPEESGLFFWAETSETDAPSQTRGRGAQNPRPKAHPFCVAPDLPGEKRKITLQLPAVRGIPLPSPQLVNAWEINTSDPVLAPFWLDGIFLSPEKALAVLLNFSSTPKDPAETFTLSPDFRYWNHAAGLVLETIAAQKIIPVIDGQAARWLPVLDTPRDAARWSQLAAASQSWQEAPALFLQRA